MRTEPIPRHDQFGYIKMRKAGKLSAETLDYIAPFVKAGVTTLELNDLCHQFITDHDAIPAPLG